MNRLAIWWRTSFGERERVLLPLDEDKGPDGACVGVFAVHIRCCGQRYDDDGRLVESVRLVRLVNEPSFTAHGRYRWGDLAHVDDSDPESIPLVMPGPPVRLARLPVRRQFQASHVLTGALAFAAWFYAMSSVEEGVTLAACMAGLFSGAGAGELGRRAGDWLFSK